MYQLSYTIITIPSSLNISDLITIFVLNLFFWHCLPVNRPYIKLYMNKHACLSCVFDM